MFLSPSLTTFILSVSLAFTGTAVDPPLTEVIHPPSVAQSPSQAEAPVDSSFMRTSLLAFMQPGESVQVPIEELPPEAETPLYHDGHFEDPAYPVPVVNGLLIVNKTYRLPGEYNPFPELGDSASNTLLPEAQEAFHVMQAEAAAQGIYFHICSGFRSYNYQYFLFNQYAASQGEERANTFSARQGQSEHQTGLAMDLCSNEYAYATLEPTFADTPPGQWLADNSWRYGFILRYPQGKEHITGYQYEPWHFRYVGIEAAQAISETPGQTLEEFLGLAIPSLPTPTT